SSSFLASSSVPLPFHDSSSAPSSQLVSGVLGGKNARIHIPDELDDVVDDEEDEAWKEWGQKKKLTEEKFDPPPVEV
ncbi:hypothetical protein Ccrd_014878, partial [Cynara cardunculus var. scolymus]